MPEIIKYFPLVFELAKICHSFASLTHAIFLRLFQTSGTYFTTILAIMQVPHSKDIFKT